jgi:hypothetical protein
MVTLSSIGGKGRGYRRLVDSRWGIGNYRLRLRVPDEGRLVSLSVIASTRRHECDIHIYIHISGKH